MTIKSLLRLSCAITMMSVVTAPVLAQEIDQTAQALKTTQDKTSQIKAETELISARTAKREAQIAALGLPSYDGKTTIGAGGGKLEAAMLSTFALNGAARTIAAKATDAHYLVLAGGESIDFGQVAWLTTDIDAVHQLFARAGIGEKPAGDVDALADPMMAIAAFSAVAGLVRADTEVTGIDLSTTITDRMLATAVAAQIGARAVFPGAFIAAADDGPPTGGWAGWTLLQKMNALAEMNDRATAARKAIPDKPNAAQKASAASLDRATGRYAKLFDRATTPDDKGAVPLAVAARLDTLIRRKPKVLRVYVDEAAGSFINTKNLVTTLGVDPVKVSGGVIVSYTVTDPASGAVTAADVITCRTTLTSLRKVQEGRWKTRSAAPETLCDQIGPKVPS